MTHRSQFPPILPAQKTQYCFVCGSTDVEKAKESGRNMYHCRVCGKLNARVLIYDPGMMQTFNKANELVHYSAGTLLVNEKKELLLFLRTKYPFLYTIPAGHISNGEDPKVAALRETEEEVGIIVPDAELVFESEIAGDECVGGADIHYWYLYLAHTTIKDVKLDEEGARYDWFTVDHIPKEITYPVQFFLQREDIRKRLT